MKTSGVSPQAVVVMAFYRAPLAPVSGGGSEPGLLLSRAPQVNACLSSSMWCAVSPQEKDNTQVQTVAGWLAVDGMGVRDVQQRVATGSGTEALSTRAIEQHLHPCCTAPEVTDAAVPVDMVGICQQPHSPQSMICCMHAVSSSITAGICGAE